MKNKTKISLIVFSLGMLISFFPVHVKAATETKPYGTGKYTRSVSRISWFMSYDNNGGWYETQINNAINNWENPGWSNPLHFVENDSNAGTMMDIYTKDNSFWDYAPSILAETFFYDSKGNSIKTPVFKNYLFTRIYLNDTKMHNLSAVEMKGTIIHEIGHTLGLQHNNENLNSIMCQTGVGRLVQTVQKVDNDAIVKFYK